MPSAAPAVSPAETISNSAVMASAGGFLDAFTYVGHGHVFANAMTGNVVLLGVALAGRDLSQAWRHLVPILAFAGGIIAARVIRHRPLSRIIAKPHLLCLIFEALCLFVAGWLPRSFPDTWLTLGIAFVASLQLATFSTVRGASYASTFTTGNLRKLTETLVTFAFDPHDAQARVLTIAFGVVCVAFFAGATCGAMSTARFGNHAAWIVAAWLALSIVELVRPNQALVRAERNELSVSG